jgi:CspA family cold shock protein
VWHSEQGWGVIDSPETPGGCWVHFSHLWNDGIPEAGPGEVVEVSGGYREVFEGETVEFEWEHPGQDGYAYRATTVQPRGPASPTSGHPSLQGWRASRSVTRFRVPN